MSCQKIDNSLSNTESKEDLTNNNYFSRVGGDSIPLTNDNILKLVISGKGGYVTSQDCPSCYSRFFEFPSYTPPANINGMLSFASMADHDKFINATYLMEDLWKYPSIDFENTESEVYHLGEESLNAFDFALNFQSLRHQYDLNEFYNHDWADTASLYVEDDDYQIILSQRHEVKIGSNYYKYISNNIIAAINNSNSFALQLVRAYGLFARHVGIQYYDENIGKNIDPFQSQVISRIQDCNDYRPISVANNLTPLSSTSNQWVVELNTSIYYDLPLSQYPQGFSDCYANYSVDWGDGSTTNFVGWFVINNKLRHTYSQIVGPGNSVTKNILVSCQVIYPQISNGLGFLLQACPQIVGFTFTSSAFVSLLSPVTQGDCLTTDIKRKFVGLTQPVNGTNYRLECKIKQKIAPLIGFAHIKATAIFTKQKGEKWKTTKSIDNIVLTLRGSVYKENLCSELHTTLGTTKSGNKKRKIKIKTADSLLGLINYFSTRKNFPLAINADFIWKYNNNQISIGNYNEVLKP